MAVAPRSKKTRSFTTRPLEIAILSHFKAHPSRPAQEQVKNTLLDLIRNGHFSEGDQLPSITAIAGTLGMNQSVAVRAYDELKKLGVVIGREHKGYFVAKQSHVAEALSEVDLSRAIYACRKLNMTSPAIKRVFERALADHERYMERERKQEASGTSVSDEPERPDSGE